MKFAVQLTLDGMIRALRMKAHELTDDHQEARRRDEIGTERVLALLSTEAGRFAMEAGDERGR